MKIVHYCCLAYLIGVVLQSSIIRIISVMNKSAFIFPLFFVFFFLTCSGQPDIRVSESVQNYNIETVVTGIPVPWGMVWLPNGDMLITNRSGELYRFSNSSLSEPIAGLPEINAFSQGGLMDLELHPDYEDNGWIYISYSSPEGDGRGANTAIMRARIEGNSLVDREVLYKAEPNSRRGQHFGGRIEFDKEGYLYFSVGDRGNRDVNPQDITRDNGKIYRLHDDGTVPDDNPFVDNPDAVKAIYSYGHRNPQGMAMHPETGQIWTHEHGPRGGDEINIIEKGNNYGWPVISYGINYNGTEFAEDTHREGMEQPAWYWDPSIAPSGMDFVTSDKYPEWKGHLLVGSLKFNYVVICYLDGNTVTREEILFDGIGRVRNIRQAPDGFLYVATEGNGIVRIVPKES